MKNSVETATGCYKCGRPGHWSRDCPFSASASASASDSNPNPNPNPIPKSNPPTRPSFNTSKSYSADKTSEKPKKPPRTRPKLTPDLLLSDDGLGYVLRHFPRAFKFRGHGHEVSDLGNLIALYSQWHSHLLPYYSFEQFIQKVEQVGSTKRVRTCIRELRERVANGGDPSKLHEPPVDNDPNCEPVVEKANNLENQSPDNEQPPLESHGTDVVQEGDPLAESHGIASIQEEMLDEIYEKATEEQPESSQRQVIASQVLSDHIPLNGSVDHVQLSETSISEQQKARMEASRLKALERATARARPSQPA